MNDIDLLIQSADEKFQINDFVGAIADYRAAALMRPSDPQYVLQNLASVEESDRVYFSRLLYERYSDLPAVYLHRARVLIETHYAKQAFDLCSDKLQSLKADDLRSEIHLRFFRLEAAAKSSDPSVLAEDFCRLWEIASHPRQRRKLLAITAQIQANEFIPVFENLLENDLFSQRLKAFLLARIEEIRLFHEAVRDLDG